MRPCTLPLLVVLAASCGCTLLDRNTHRVTPPKLKPAPVLVRPDDVTPSNAHQMARFLNEELDRDLDAEADLP